MNTLVCVALVALVTVFGVNAHPGGGRGGRGPPPPRPPFSADAVRSKWNRTIDSLNVVQGGFSSQADQIVIVGTFGGDLKPLYLRRSAVLYDFSGTDAPQAAVRFGMTCYLIPFPTGATLASLTQELADRNGTTVTAALDAPVYLSGVGGKKADADRATFVENNQAVGNFCRFADIVDTTVATAADIPDPVPEGQSVDNFLTLNANVTVVGDAPQEPPRGSPPSGDRPPPPHHRPSGGRGGRGGKRG